MLKGRLGSHAVKVFHRILLRDILKLQCNNFVCILSLTNPPNLCLCYGWVLFCNTKDISVRERAVSSTEHDMLAYSVTLIRLFVETVVWSPEHDMFMHAVTLIRLFRPQPYSGRTGRSGKYVKSLPSIKSSTHV